MIREINRNNIADWNEKIQIEITLKDLQMLYDCVGSIPFMYIKSRHKDTKFGQYIEITGSKVFTDLYNGLDEIITEHNGVKDDDIMVNDNVNLKLIGV